MFLQRQPCTGLQSQQPGHRASKPGRPVPPVSASANGASTNGHTNGHVNGHSTGVQVKDIYGNTTVLGPTMNAGAPFQMPGREAEPVSPEVQEILEAQGIDLEISGLKYLNNEGRVSLTCSILLGQISHPF